MWIVCITSVRHVLTVNGYGGRQTKENEKSWCFKGWETLANKYFIWLLMLFSPGVDQTQGKNHAPDKTNGKTKIKWTKNEPPVLSGQ